MLESTDIAEGVGKLALDLYDYCSPWVEFDEAKGEFEVRYWMGDHHGVPDAT